MNTENQYMLGFNNGYLLALYEPKIVNSISQNVAQSTNYLNGFFAGKNQLEFEKTKNKMTQLEHLRNKSREKEDTLERE